MININHTDTDGPRITGAEIADKLRSNVLKEMEEVPREEKAAYLKAAGTCPQLILSESDPHRFLRHAKGCALEAAKLLASHWKFRLLMFGEERAFRPLNDLSGQGALTEEDIQHLKSGYLVCLPNDSQGRTVLFANAFQADAGVAIGKEASQGRGYFYLFQYAAAQDRPYVVLRFADEKFTKSRMRAACSFFQCFPKELSGYYGLFNPPFGAARMFKETMIPLFMQYLGDNVGRVTQNAVHEAPKDMLQDLLQFGFEKESLPECVGGTWSYDNFAHWVDSRQPLQQQQQGVDRRGTVRKATGEMPVSTNKDDESEEDEDDPESSPQDSTGTLLARKLRRRQQNVIYSRRKRERKRDNEKRIMHQEQDLRRENEKLRREEVRLKALLQDAEKQALESERNALAAALLRQSSAGMSRMPASYLPANPPGLPL
jgi:hypothetical protein